MSTIQSYWTKIQSYWTKLTTYKASALLIVENVYKAIYILNYSINYAIETATTLNLDVATITKIATYVAKIKNYTDMLAAKLGITLDTEFIAEAKSLVVDQSASLPRTASKRAKLTTNDILNSQAPAFAKIDELLK